ncbi:hypothetical protein TKK_0003370 [Trichogramma kaykai]
MVWTCISCYYRGCVDVLRRCFKTNREPTQLKIFDRGDRLIRPKNLQHTVDDGDTVEGAQSMSRTATHRAIEHCFELNALRFKIYVAFDLTLFHASCKFDVDEKTLVFCQNFTLLARTWGKMSFDTTLTLSQCVRLAETSLPIVTFFVSVVVFFINIVAFFIKTSFKRLKNHACSIDEVSTSAEKTLFHTDTSLLDSNKNAVECLWPWCVRCWEYGHLDWICEAPVDRSRLCYYCGQSGHPADICENPPACVRCPESANHSSRSRQCPLAKIIRPVKVTESRIDQAFGRILKISSNRNEILKDFIRSNQYVPIYTDGSKFPSRVGWAMWCPADEEAWLGNMSSKVSICKAESRAILAALEYALKNTHKGRKYIIITDSLDSLRNLRFETRIGRRKTRLASRMKNKWLEFVRSDLEGSVNFLWVKGHKGIRGNIVADSLARIAASHDGQKIIQIKGTTEYYERIGMDAEKVTYASQRRLMEQNLRGEPRAG